MNRLFTPKAKSVLCALLLFVMLAGLQSGCVSALTTAAWLIKGSTIPAEYKELKGKKIAVVCRPLIELQYSASTSHTEIAQQLTRKLQQNIKNVKMVPSDEIAAWTDENTWHEFTEIGEAMDAEVVIGIDLDQFSLYQGQTLYQGKARMSVKVFDMKQGGKIVYEKRLGQLLYPPNSGIPTSDRSEGDFRREFVGVAAEQIGRLFYPHDGHADYALDSRAGL